jgi:hypothetical protein
MAISEEDLIHSTFDFKDCENQQEELNLPIIPFGNKYISLLISFKIKKFCQGNIPVSLR